VSRFSIYITALAIGVVALVGGRAAAASADTPPLPPQSSNQTVSVERPPGQIVVSGVSLSQGGRLQVTVTDTRPEDPGWTVSVTIASDEAGTDLGWKPSVRQDTPAFTDSHGTAYAQQVEAGPPINPGGNGSHLVQDAVLGSAPPGHGLGIAVLDAKVTAVGQLGSVAPTVTVTVV